MGPRVRQRRRWCHLVDMTHGRNRGHLRRQSACFPVLRELPSISKRRATTASDRQSRSKRSIALPHNLHGEIIVGDRPASTAGRKAFGIDRPANDHSACIDASGVFVPARRSSLLSRRAAHRAMIEAASSAIIEVNPVFAFERSRSDKR